MPEGIPVSRNVDQQIERRVSSLGSDDRIICCGFEILRRLFGKRLQRIILGRSAPSPLLGCLLGFLLFALTL